MLLQAVALVGAAMILGAYLALQRGWLDRTDARFNLLNLVGSALLTWVALVDRRWGFVLLEASWAVLSLLPLLRPPAPTEEDG